TTFPGGQIPSIFDKLAAAFVVLGIIKVLGGRVNQYVLSGLIGIVGTIVSGAIFLGSALVISGLPLPFSVLFTTVVLPATAINTVAVIILYPVVVFSKSAVEKVGNKSA
ncbi:MAG: tryptophan transporter, partial [Bacillota bacterium]